MSNIPAVITDAGIFFPAGHGVPDWIRKESIGQLYMALDFDPLNSRERQMVCEELKRREAQEALNAELKRESK